MGGRRCLRVALPAFFLLLFAQNSQNEMASFELNLNRCKFLFISTHFERMGLHMLGESGDLKLLLGHAKQGNIIPPPNKICRLLSLCQ